jgi:hypothetical protein
MICGHIGVALGARALRRDVPLGWLLAASVAPDVLDGIEPLAHVWGSDGLFSHSLPVIAALIILLSGAAFLFLGTTRAATLVAVMVIAHLLPDYVTGQKILWPHGPVVGFDLYRWPLLDFALEVPVIALGWWMLRRAATDPRWITSWVALLALVATQAFFNYSQAGEPPYGAHAAVVGGSIPIRHNRAVPLPVRSRRSAPSFMV